MYLSDAGVSGGSESHGLGVGFGLLGKLVRGGLERLGDVGGGGDDEARGHGGFRDEGAVAVGGMHGHF